MIPLILRADISGVVSDFAVRVARDLTGAGDAIWLSDEENTLSCGSARIRLEGVSQVELAGDVLFVRPATQTVQRVIRAASRHNYFLVTEQCDQLCLMCSQPPKKTHHDQYALFADAVRLAPENALITITGGEPTLHKDDLFALLETAVARRPDVHFQVLSNAQHFRVEDIPRLRRVAHNTNWGVPLYAAQAELHDVIVGKQDAFSSLEQGLAILARAGAPIELRTVVLQANVRQLEATALYIASNLSFVRRWAIMQLENIGFARNRWSDLFFDNSTAFAPIGEALDIVRAADIETLLYNFPLCTVPGAYRRFAPSTISDWKRKYLPECRGCTVREQCGGFFEWYPAAAGFSRIGL